MSRLILHIGQTKTATTTIQAFLHRNQLRLADHGLHYLARPGDARSHRFLFHLLHLETFTDSHRLVRIGMERLAAMGLILPGQSPADVCERAWKLLAASLPAASDATGLISEELFWHLGGFHQERRLVLLRTLRRRLLELVDPADLLVVACVRHHADWAESWHNQLVKDNGNQTPIHRFVGHLAREGAFCYGENLEDWRSVFPEAELVVLDFHGQLLTSGEPPGVALLEACHGLKRGNPHLIDQLEQPRPLQEAIHPFVHHWITRAKPVRSSAQTYKRSVRRASRQVSRLAEKRFGQKRFTLLTPEQSQQLINWANEDHLSTFLGEFWPLASRLPQRDAIPRPIPKRAREILMNAFDISQRSDVAT